MKTITAYSGSYKPIFSGTVHDLIDHANERKQAQTTLIDYPSYKFPIDFLEIGDRIEYDRTKSAEIPVYQVEEIHKHGADENQRVVVMKRLMPPLAEKERNERSVFNARFLVGGKVADIYFPTRAIISNVDAVVANRQKINAVGYPSRK